MVFEVRQSEKVAPLFEGCRDTMIWSCLQNMMWHLYTNSIEMPVSAMALLGDFCFFVGKPDRELVLYKPEWCEQDFVIMVPENKGWEELIVSCYQEKAKKVTRYAVKKEPDVFDRAGLENAVEGLPDGYVIKMIDEELFLYCKENSWCRDFVSQYADYEMYQNCGLGVVVLKGGEVVSGASSYSGYRGGIEIEVDTKEEFRRRGLAYVCCAKLILECQKRGWYASWDAQNKWSLSLAEKLGYHYERDYTVYEIYGY